MLKNIKNKNIPANLREYKKIGIISAGVLAVLIAIAGISMMGGDKVQSVEKATNSVSEQAASADTLNIAVIRMDAIQNEADVLKALRTQREGFEKDLQKDLESEQKDLEEEKKEIEESQDMLSQEALQRRVVEYQNRIGLLQRNLTEKAQNINVAYQTSLDEIQKEHLDPIIEKIIEKKNLSLVLDGRFTRIGEGVKNLDITNDVIDALNKRIKTTKMDTPKGM